MHPILNNTGIVLGGWICVLVGVPRVQSTKSELIVHDIVT